MRYRSGLLAIILMAVAPILLSLPSYASDSDLSKESSLPATELAGNLLPTSTTIETSEVVLDETPVPPTPPVTEPSDSVDSTPSNLSPDSPTEPVVQPDVPIATKLLIGSFKTDGASNQEFVTIYNPANVAVRLSNEWYLQAWNRDGSTQQFVYKFSDEVIPPRSSIVVRSKQLLSPQSLITSTMIMASRAGTHYTNGHLLVNGSLELVYKDHIHDQVGWNDSVKFEMEKLTDSGKAWTRCMVDGIIVDNNNNRQDYILIDEVSINLESLPVCPSASDIPNDDEHSEPIERVPLSSCVGVVISEIGANLDEQFIELFNPTDRYIDLAGCVVKTNRSHDRKLILDGTVLAPNQSHFFVVNSDNIILTKTTAGSVYLIDTDATELEEVKYSYLKAGTSLMRAEDGSWLETYTPSPGAANNYQQFPSCQSGYSFNSNTGRCNKLPESAGLTPCAPNQERSLETNRCRVVSVAQASLAECGPNQYRHSGTNRCRNVALSVNELVPCRIGQYRSPETNRCRAVQSATQSLAPCKPNQVRNPETNRCRNVAVAANSLKACAANQERNPETNRCRKVASTNLPRAAYAVEPIGQSKQSQVSQWGLAGMGMLALGYAGWQWRYELRGLVQRLANFMPRGK